MYAISDIHGCTRLLQQMFRVIDADVAHRPPRHSIEVYMGDYVDRGPDSRGTLDLLIERGRRGNTVFLKGNHEAFLEEILQTSSRIADWLRFGGLETLMSYGITPTSTNPDLTEQISLSKSLEASMPSHHKEFLQRLRLSFVCGDFLFVHAGVRPGIPLTDQKESDLLWIREEFLQSEEQFGKYNVH